MILEQAGEVARVLAAGAEVALKLPQLLGAVVLGEAGDADEPAFFPKLVFQLLEIGGESGFLGSNGGTGFFQRGEAV